MDLLKPHKTGRRLGQPPKSALTLTIVMQDEHKTLKTRNETGRGT